MLINGAEPTGQWLPRARVPVRSSMFLRTILRPKPFMCCTPKLSLIKPIFPSFHASEMKQSVLVTESVCGGLFLFGKESRKRVRLRGVLRSALFPVGLPHAAHAFVCH